jgi:hypothetical protein
LFDATPFSSVPVLCKAVWRGRGVSYTSLDAHDHNHGFVTALNYEAFVVLDRAVHNLAELRAGNMGIYSAIHIVLQWHQSIDALDCNRSLRPIEGMV